MIITITGVLFLSTLVEGLITYIAGERSDIDHPRAYLKYVSLFLGVVLAILYNVRIPQWLGIPTNYPLIDYIVSGIIIGRGSNYVNDIIGAFAKKNNVLR